jgi:hypothetical protein
MMKLLKVNKDSGFFVFISSCVLEILIWKGGRWGWEEEREMEWGREVAWHRENYNMDLHLHLHTLIYCFPNSKVLLPSLPLTLLHICTGEV